MKVKLMSRNQKPLVERSAVFRSTSDDSDDGLNLEGYAAVFNTPTEINSYEGHFIERVAPGAFKKTVSERLPRMQFDHGRDSRVGSIPIGYYTDVREDAHGLWVQGRLHDNDLILPIRQAIASGAVDSMSFKFRVIQDEWRDGKGNRVAPERVSQLIGTGELTRTIREVAMAECGPVVYPAYASTSVGVRNNQNTRMTLNLAEKRMRMAGLL